MTKPNTELAERVMQHIEDDPSSWDQGVWVSTWNPCGTTMCYAGTVLSLSGYRVHPRLSRFVDAHNTPIPGDDVPGIAAELLGMTEEQLYPVFHCYTDDPAVLRERLEHVLVMANIPVE